jgi:hypothetical protein
MNPTFRPRVLDAEEARQLDAEFEAELLAGTLPSLNVPPLDPSSDPFGRGFSWLRPPTDPFGLAFESLANRGFDELMKSGGAELRTAALAGAFAGGTDEAVVKTWALEQFPTLCLGTGHDGEDLLELLRSKPKITPALVREVVEILNLQPEFAALPLERRVAAALIIVDVQQNR